MAGTEYERLLEEKQSLEEAYLQAVKEQERVLVEGEVKKARIRARLGEIERRLAEIRGT